MKIFAIELSSQHGSMALMDADHVVVEKSWIENFKNRQQLFDALAAVEVDWDRVDAFVVGRGPGAFSGMRISFSLINALAAPCKKPVYALNSGAALAMQMGAPQTVVVGDARRNKVWAGLFIGNELQQEFQLLERDKFADFVPADALVVSPDYDRLVNLLDPFKTIKESVFPTAGILAKLAQDRLKNDRSFEPSEPLYMHPPVFIAPRFSP